MCVLNITRNTATPTPPQDDEDPVPSTSKKPFTVAAVSSGHCAWPLPCALSEQVVFLQRMGQRRTVWAHVTFLTAESFLVFITVTTSSIPQEFLLTLSVVGVTFKLEVKGRIFIFEVNINLPRHFRGRRTCCPQCLNTWSRVGTLLFPMSEDGSSLHKPR